MEAPTAPSLEEFGAGKACGIVLGVFFGILAFAYVFFMPYATRRLIKNDARLRWYHIPLGPMLRKENPWLYFPGDPNGEVVTDHYKTAHRRADPANNTSALMNHPGKNLDPNAPKPESKNLDSIPSDPEQNTTPLLEDDDKEFMYASGLKSSDPALANSGMI